MSKQSESRVLMVLPTLGKRADTLRLTLESLKSQEVPHDIVMVYPLQSRETEKLAREYGAMMVDDPKGMSAAVNAGVASAKPQHEFIGWIGDDDLLRPGSLKAAVAALDKKPKAVLAYGYCDYINEKGTVITTSRAGKLAPWIMYWGPNLMPLPGMLFRRSALDEAGEFDTDNKYSMDLEMLFRLHKIGTFVNTKTTLAAFRWHSTSQTVSNRDAVLEETERVKRKYLPRYVRPLAPLWERPVRIATKVASRHVSTKAAKGSG